MTSLRPAWKLVRFGDMVTSAGATRKSRGWSANEAGVDRYVGLEHLDSYSLKIRRWGSPQGVGQNSDLRPFEPGDVILARRGIELRKIGVAEFHGVASGHALVFRARAQVVLPEFLPFFMQSDVFMSRADRFSVGSLSRTVNLSALVREEFALPPLEEQRRIAQLLKGAVEVEDKLHRLERSLDALYAAGRESVFSRSDTMAIEVGSLLAEIVPGRSPQAINEPPRGTQEKGVLKVSAVGAGVFLPQESKALLDQSEFEDKFRVRDSDLLMTRANTPAFVGMCCVVEGNHPNLMLSDKTLRLIPRSGIDAWLLMEALWSRDVRRQIRSGATGTGGAMKNISQDKIRRLSVRFPTGPETGIAAEKLRELRAARRATSLRRAAAAVTRRRLVNALMGETAL
jgi:type I restriction enzyme, S subunit